MDTREEHSAVKKLMIYPGGDINVRQRVNSQYCCNGGQTSSGIRCKSCAIRELKLCERLIVGFVCRRKGGEGPDKCSFVAHERYKKHRWALVGQCCSKQSASLPVFLSRST